MYCENQYVQRLIDMTKAGLIPSLKTIINYDDDASLRDDCKAAGLNLLKFTEIQLEGSKLDVKF